MTTDEHWKQIVGDLVLRVAHLLAEIDALKAQLAAKSEPPHGE